MKGGGRWRGSNGTEKFTLYLPKHHHEETTASIAWDLHLAVSSLLQGYSHNPLARSMLTSPERDRKENGGWDIVDYRMVDGCHQLVHQPTIRKPW